MEKIEQVNMNYDSLSVFLNGMYDLIKQNQGFFDKQIWKRVDIISQRRNKLIYVKIKDYKFPEGLDKDLYIEVSDGTIYNSTNCNPKDIIEICNAKYNKYHYNNKNIDITTKERFFNTLFNAICDDVYTKNTELSQQIEELIKKYENDCKKVIPNIVQAVALKQNDDAQQKAKEDLLIKFQNLITKEEELNQKQQELEAKLAEIKKEQNLIKDEKNKLITNALNLI